MDKQSKIYVAGHTGLVGSAIMRKLTAEGYNNVVTLPSKELDLTCQCAVDDFFGSEMPEYVFLAAAKVGGIMANNTLPAEFIYNNLMITANIINAAYASGVKKLLNLGSSCIYPKACPQPIKEEYLLSGYLEPTNEPYAVAKIAGLKLCQSYNRQYGTNYISVMPTNLYGPGDHFDLNSSHVVPALIRKCHEAMLSGSNSLTIWGTGTPMREFLYVEDLADALYFLMQKYDSSDIINVGTGVDITIKDLALMIMDVVGFKGELICDTTKPDGTMRKVLDTSKINSLGWTPRTSLKEGLIAAYKAFLATLK